MKPKKPRKPRALKYEYLYGGIDTIREEGPSVYIGGRYYDGCAQIHLRPQEVRRLSKWLESAARYLESKGER